MSSLGRASASSVPAPSSRASPGCCAPSCSSAAIGAVGSRAGDAFAVANQLPNNLYAIISTGILTAVIVPQIVKVSADPDGGRAFISKLFTLGTVVLLATTALAMAVRALPGAALRRPLRRPTSWRSPRRSPTGACRRSSSTASTPWSARRSTRAGSSARSRGRPIVNNLVSIAGFLLFIAALRLRPRRRVAEWTADAIAWLAGTATLGIVVQAGVLLLFWRRTGIRVRPDFRWRGVGLNHIGRLAGWTFLMVLAGQLAGLVQTRIVWEASGAGASVFAMQNAWLIFMLPYSIIVLSIGTPYFTQLSEHAVAGRDDEVRSDIGRSIRILGFFIVIATAALAVPPRSRHPASSPTRATHAVRGRRRARVLPGRD